ncbi:unnamed protein product, partial [Polarella glacialis]
VQRLRAAKVMAPFGQRLGEVQTCAGIGWVKFDPQLLQKHMEQHQQRKLLQQHQQPADSRSASAVHDVLLSHAPEVRCFGLRLSQEAVPSSGRRESHSDDQEHQPASSTSSSAPGRSAAAAAPAARTAFAEVAEQTWAVVCAGQLSIIVPEAASGASWEPCAVRCEGVSFRIERVQVPANSRSVAATPSEQSSEVESSRPQLRNPSEGFSVGELVPEGAQ